MAERKISQFDNAVPQDDSLFVTENGAGTDNENHTFLQIKTSVQSFVNSALGSLAFLNTVSGAQIDDTSVTNAKLDDMPQDTIKGRITSAGTPQDLTASQVRTLINVEDGANVTDTANVDAAGAVMNTDTTTAEMAFVVDEDDMVSDDATKVPTQQSVKAYVDSNSTSISFAMLKYTSASLPGIGANGQFPLNTEVYDYDNIVTLTSNQFSLIEGTYLVSASFAIFNDIQSATRLYNVSDSITEYDGHMASSDTSDPSFVYAPLDGVIVVPSGGKTYEVRLSGGTGAFNPGGSFDYGFIKFMKIS